MGARMQLTNTMVKNSKISFLYGFILYIGRGYSQIDMERNKITNEL